MRTPLQKGEKILLVTYTSWTTLVLPFFFALAGIVASYFIGFIERYGWIAAVVGIAYGAWKYMAWKVSIWVVTNFRVIDEAGLISHFAKESPLDKINNVSYDMTPLGRIFNYGHVEIQTAAEVGATDYFNVNHPRRLKDTITAAQSDYKTLQSTAQARQMAEAFSASIGGQYAQMPGAGHGFGPDAGSAGGYGGGVGYGGGTPGAGSAASQGGRTGYGAGAQGGGQQMHGGGIGYGNGSGQGGNGAGASGAAQTAGHGGGSGLAAELEKLFDLKQKGALSEEEYLRAKSRLLGH